MDVNIPHDNLFTILYSVFILKTMYVQLVDAGKIKLHNI